VLFDAGPDRFGPGDYGAVAAAARICFVEKFV